MTFTTAYYVYIWDSRSLLSTNVWYDMSTASWTIVLYVNENQTTVYTIVWHRLGKVGAIYWSIIMYIISRQMCALTFAGQRKCGVFSTVVPSAVLWVVVLVSTVVLTTVFVATVWWGWQFDKWRQKFVMIKSHHCRTNMCSREKNVSGTKMCYFWQLWEEWRKEGAVRVEDCTRDDLLHSLYCGVVVLYDNIIVGIQGVEPCLNMSVQSHGVRWTWFEQRVSFDSRCAVLHWLLEHGCSVLCTRVGSN